MRQLDIASLGPRVCDLARQAGRRILQIYADCAPGGRGALLGAKEDASPLTHADLASNDVICEGLARLTPEVSVVSEEQGAGRPHGGHEGEFWLVDPLDGTREFLARNGEFTVNIALVRKGEPVWGVVYAPALDLMYWGGQGVGASRAGGGRIEPIRVRAQLPAGAPVRVVASKSHLNAETSRFIEALGRTELVQAGSSLKFCRVAEGAADLYPRLAPTREWDTAAAQAVLEGAGGHVRDTAGARLRYGKPDVLNPHFIASAQPLAEPPGS